MFGGLYPFDFPVREGVEALTYAEFIVATKIKSIKPAGQRDARWDVEREGREPKVEPPSEAVKVYTGDFGTSARHPPRERIDSQVSKSSPREGVAALPYAETSMNKINEIGR